jgi:hypothetical protein
MLINIRMALAAIVSICNLHVIFYPAAQVMYEPSNGRVDLKDFERTRQNATVA